MCTIAERVLNHLPTLVLNSKDLNFIPIILAAVVHYGLVIGSIKLAVVTLVPIDERNIA